MWVFGNINNRIMEHTTGKPEVGMGATICQFSDRTACTVIEIKSAHRIVVQQDNAIRIDSNGMSDSQDYRYEANPEGIKTIFTKRRNGVWREHLGSVGLRLGDRDHYHDFGF